MAYLMPPLACSDSVRHAHLFQDGRWREEGGRQRQQTDGARGVRTIGWSKASYSHLLRVFTVLMLFGEKWYTLPTVSDHLVPRCLQKSNNLTAMGGFGKSIYSQATVSLLKIILKNYYRMPNKSLLLPLLGRSTMLWHGNTRCLWSKNTPFTLSGLSPLSQRGCELGGVSPGGREARLHKPARSLEDWASKNTIYCRLPEGHRLVELTCNQGRPDLTNQQGH